MAVEVVRTTDTDIEHCFEFGRPVQFFSIEDSDTSKKAIRYFRFTATVSYADGDRLVITVPDNTSILDLQNAERLGVQLSFDETSYRLMMEALDKAIKGKGRLGYLRDLFYSRQKPETFVFPPMHFPYLNHTQEDAVNMVLRAKDVAIVHGPPGTGKTTTLVEAVRETEPSAGLCAKQYGGRLDFREVSRSWHQCSAHWQSQ